LSALSHLASRVNDRTARVGVIGLGYVGLAVACALAEAGFRVTGVELRADRVEKIRMGECPIDGIEPGLPDLVKKVVASKHLDATTQYSALADVDVVLICVDTPVARDRRPRFEALRSTCWQLGPVLKEGALVIVESTVAPGTTMGLVAPQLAKHSNKELNEGFFLGHCPERVMPGRLLKNLRELSRVCGGSTPEAARAMVALYRTIVEGELDETDCITAELTKTAENTYRDVNIAFANQLGLICEAVGADFERVRGFVNKSPGRNVLWAGAGVGGHCIPKDPWLLVHGVPGVDTGLIAAARTLNESMPLHVARLVEQALDEVNIGMHSARLLVLGYSYLEDSDDTRNSPSQSLIEHLKDWGADVVVHDPWVPEYAVDLWKRAEGAHAAIVMVAHAEYRDLDLARLRGCLRAPVLVDGRQVVDGAAARAAGFVFRGLGRA
jgi:UDP-N-acetyl-D-mannosaminuronic acid dehydrogenase